MSTRATLLVSLLLTPIFAGSCGPGSDLDVLPGHSRPIFEHDWPHPSELTFEDAGFQPADPASALVTTPSGVRAYILPDPAEPLVEVTAVVPLGPNLEGDGEAGAAQVVSRLLDRALSEHLGSELVATSEVSQDRDLTLLSVQVLAEDWRPALTALVRALRHPGLTFAAIGATRTAGGASGSGSNQAIAELARLVARYPLAPLEPGTTVQPSAVIHVGERALHPGSVVFGIGGGVPRADAEAAFLELTSGWVARSDVRAPTLQPPTPAAARPLPGPLHTVDMEIPQAQIALGHAMAPLEPEDEAAFAVMTEVVNIRLNIATREMRGLTNRAMLVPPIATDGAGVLYVRTSGRWESVGPLVRYSVEEIGRIGEASGAPTAEELAQAKGGLTLARWEDALDGARATAATFAMETVRRGSLDHLMAWPAAVRAVSVEDVTYAARKYIDPSAITAVVLGQIDEIREARHPRWPVAFDEVPALIRPPGSGP